MVEVYTVPGSRTACCYSRSTSVTDGRVIDRFRSPAAEPTGESAPRTDARTASDHPLPMSESSHLVSKAIEMQRDTVENGQRTFQQAVELPLQQTVEFQKSAADAIKNGLQMTNWAQRQGIELTTDALDTYVTTVENAVRDTERATQSEGSAVGTETESPQPQSRRQPEPSQSRPAGQQFQQPTAPPQSQQPVARPPQGDQQSLRPIQQPLPPQPSHQSVQQPTGQRPTRSGGQPVQTTQQPPQQSPQRPPQRPTGPPPSPNQGTVTEQPPTGTQQTQRPVQRPPEQGSPERRPPEQEESQAVELAGQRT